MHDNMTSPPDCCGDILHNNVEDAKRKNCYTETGGGIGLLFWRKAQREGCSAGTPDRKTAGWSAWDFAGDVFSKNGAASNAAAADSAGIVWRTPAGTGAGTGPRAGSAAVASATVFELCAGRVDVVAVAVWGVFKRGFAASIMPLPGEVFFG